jgi:hypothetical protein
MSIRTAGSMLAALWLVAAPLAAQTPSTRAEEIAKDQEEKAASLSPPRPLWIERKLLEIEEAGGFAVVRGFFVAFGDIKSGSGFAIGPAYGRTFDNGGVVTAKAGYSIRNFKLIQLFGQAPPLARGKVMLSGRARWQDAPELAVFPLGTESPNTRADYSETMTEVSGRATFLPAKFLRFGAGLGYEAFDTGGADTGRLSVEEAFTPSQLPGLDADPNYLHTFVSAAVDSGAGRGFSRSGSLLEATWHDYRQRNTGAFSFQRLDGIARQLIPILSGNWVIDLSLRGTTTTADEGEQVPFFLMPDLGGGNDLRGYGNYRFRDRHALLFTAEYRWYVQEFVDMAIFYDAGKVAPRRGDLDFDDMKNDVGVGIRFHGPQTTVLRIEVARSNEGTRFIFAFSAPVR